MKKAKVSMIKIEQFLRKNAGSMTTVDICEELQVSPFLVRKVADKAGISLTLNSKATRLKRAQEAILKHYKTHTCGDIAKMVDEKHGYVWSVAKRIGIELKVKQRSAQVIPETGYFKTPPGFNWLLGFRA